MKQIETIHAVGHVLCQDITQIVPGVFKGPAFRKGHVVREEDIPLLLSLGKEHLYIWEVREGMLHEDEGAQALCALCMGTEGAAPISPTPVKEGKIDLIADCDGLLEVDTHRLRLINSLGELIIATRHGGFAVKAGDKLAGARVIPLVIAESKLDEARRIAADRPLLTLRPFAKKRAGLITTGNEVYRGRIQDAFSPVVAAKLSEYGTEVERQVLLPDDPAAITAAIVEMRGAGLDLILCTGGMSVDPDDRTPLAIKNAGAHIVGYGAPVLPGAMFLLSYLDSAPVLGLPGCVMYAKRTIFDLILPRLLADVPVCAEDLAALGHGGLCLSCESCTFPACGFGKGA